MLRNGAVGRSQVVARAEVLLLFEEPGHLESFDGINARVCLIHISRTLLFECNKALFMLSSGNA